MDHLPDFVFILLIALFNVIGSLSMLILEKKQDAGILKRLGADHKTIRSVFVKAL